jgi:uncharacterized protein
VNPSAASAVHVVAVETSAAQRWKNGGGITRELLAWPHAHEWILRVSVADIERDGPFSSFPDVERWFAVLAGAGVELGVSPPRKVTMADPPYQFEGTHALHCHLLDGPTRDLNVMIHRDRGTGWMRSVSADGGAIHWQTSTRDSESVRGIFTAVSVDVFADDARLAVAPPMSLLWQSVSIASAPATWHVVQHAHTRIVAKHFAWAFECVRSDRLIVK